MDHPSWFNVSRTVLDLTNSFHINKALIMSWRIDSLKTKRVVERPLTCASATFRSFAESTKEDWDDLTEQYKVVQGRVASQVIEQLEKLRGEFLGYPVDRLEHSLQTATRAERDGRAP